MLAMIMRRASGLTNIITFLSGLDPLQRESRREADYKDTWCIKKINGCKDRELLESLERCKFHVISSENSLPSGAMVSRKLKDTNLWLRSSKRLVLLVLALARYLCARSSNHHYRVYHRTVAASPPRVYTVNLHLLRSFSSCADC